MVIFDNKSSSHNNSHVSAATKSNDNESGAAFLVRIMRYLETPQYLRKALFPMHGSLRFVVRHRFIASCDFCSTQFIFLVDCHYVQFLLIASYIVLDRVCCPHLTLHIICASMSGRHIGKVKFFTSLILFFYKDYL